MEIRCRKCDGFHEHSSITTDEFPHAFNGFGQVDEALKYDIHLKLRVCKNCGHQTETGEMPFSEIGRLVREVYGDEKIRQASQKNLLALSLASDPDPSAFIHSFYNLYGKPAATLKDGSTWALSDGEVLEQIDAAKLKSAFHVSNFEKLQSMFGNDARVLKVLCTMKAFERDVLV